MDPIVDAIETQTDHPPTPSIRVACCSALIERMLRVLNNKSIDRRRLTTANYLIETTDLNWRMLSSRSLNTLSKFSTIQ